MYTTKLFSRKHKNILQCSVCSLAKYGMKYCVMPNFDSEFILTFFGHIYSLFDVDLIT